jgi:xanthine/uracil/vitamin C permease (AzgA family)
LIPLPIQVGTAIGIGLLTTLAGCTEINLVEKGTYNILKFGAITSKVCIAFFGVFIICVAINYHVKVVGQHCMRKVL